MLHEELQHTELQIIYELSYAKMYFFLNQEGNMPKMLLVIISGWYRTE